MKPNTLSHCATILWLIAALGLFAAPSARSEDMIPPTVLSATYTPGSGDVFVTFSEPMTIISALDPFSYVLITRGFIGEADHVAQSDPLGMTFRVSFLTLITHGSELRVDQAMDLAGNIVTPSPTTLFIQPVPEPNVVSVAGLGAILIYLFGRKQRGRP